MIDFLRTLFSVEDVAGELDVDSSEVGQLARDGRLVARDVETGSGMVRRFNPADVSRLKVVRDLAGKRQNPLEPDIVWVERACTLLAKRIAYSNFDPQRIVGIAFGGVLPAAFLGVFLRRPLYVFRVVHYEGRVRLPKPIIATELESFPDVATLVVDDLVDSGETMGEVLDYLNSHGVRNIRFATLHRKLSSPFIPDWYVDVIDDWVRYPWEDE